jgi:cell division initiation protein
MKLTPLDIRHKEFKRGMRGYTDVEVDEFLDEVADEYERLFKENIDLRDRIEMLEEKVAGYQRIEETLQKTLVNAQANAEEQKQNASKEAQLILQDAELKSRQMVNEAYSERQTIEQSLAKLKSAQDDFRFKFRQMLEGYLQQLGDGPSAATRASEADFARHAEAIKEAIAREAAPAPAASPAPVPAASPSAVPAAAEASAGQAPQRPAAEPVTQPVPAAPGAEEGPAAPAPAAAPAPQAMPVAPAVVTGRGGVEAGRRRAPDDPEATMSREPAGGDPETTMSREPAPATRPAPVDAAPVTPPEDESAEGRPPATSEPAPVRERILFGETDDLLADVDTGVNENEFKW